MRADRPANEAISDGRPDLPKRTEPIYQAIWADTIDFNEVLISPVMVHDHMPDTVLSALNKVSTAPFDLSNWASFNLRFKHSAR